MCRVIDSSGSVWQWVCNALIIPGSRFSIGTPYSKGDCVGVFSWMIRKKGVILQTVLQVATVAEQELSIIKKASKAHDSSMQKWQQRKCQLAKS